MMENTELSRTKSAVIIYGALALSLFTPGIPAAGNSGARYGCVAKAAGGYFTDGAVVMTEYPCKVNPAAVEDLAKANNVEGETDQVNFDRLWNQEYYTENGLVTDIRQTGEGEAQSVRPGPVVYSDFGAPLDRIAKLKASFGFRCVEDLTAQAEVALYAAAHKEETEAWTASPTSLRTVEYLLRGAEEKTASCPLCVSMRLQFPAGEATVLEVHWDAISRVAGFMKVHPEVNLRVEGHMDNVFSPAYSQDLSQRRANAVRQELLTRFGIAARRVTAQGFGSTRPIADNTDLAERYRNRRVIAVVTSASGEDASYYQCSQEKAPALTDTDGDGAPDFTDKCPGTPKGSSVDDYGCVTITLDMEFAPNAVAIGPGGEDQLKRLATLLQAAPGATAEIQGHSDNSESPAENNTLSQARAEAVRELLITRFNIAPARLTARGYGQTRPVALNNTPENKRLNRRVVAAIDLHQ
ncbi:MAG: OmpA family protein [Elusimicrobiota bacterium]